MSLSSRSNEPSDFTVTADNLCKRFNREWIFRGLNYKFISGNTYAITGPNGSGKSTLLQVLWGQVPQSSGSIGYKKGTHTVAIEEVFRHISIAAPYMDLIDEFTLQEMLEFHFKMRKLRPGLSLDDLPRLMYLDEARDKPLINFSSGMKQRLKLAMAFYTDSDVIFLDEPGTNLDTRAFNWYLQELANLPGKSIIIIASNNPEEYPASAQILQITDFKRTNGPQPNRPVA